MSPTRPASSACFFFSSFSEHQLTGQPNYIINGGITVNLFKGNFEATGSFNRTGDYNNTLGSSDLDVHLANGNNIPLAPHYRVMARNMVDLVFSQFFMHKKGQVKFKVTNLLKADYIIYQDLQGNKKFDKPVVETIPGIWEKELNYKSGLDNTPSWIKGQRTYALSIAYTF
jgi:hypothetical protein